MFISKTASFVSPSINERVHRTQTPPKLISKLMNTYIYEEFEEIRDWICTKDTFERNWVYKVLWAVQLHALFLWHEHIVVLTPNTRFSYSLWGLQLTNLQYPWSFLYCVYVICKWENYQFKLKHNTLSLDIFEDNRSWNHIYRNGSNF